MIGGVGVFYGDTPIAWIDVSAPFGVASGGTTIVGIDGSAHFTGGCACGLARHRGLPAAIGMAGLVGGAGVASGGTTIAGIDDSAHFTGGCA